MSRISCKVASLTLLNVYNTERTDSLKTSKRGQGREEQRGLGGGTDTGQKKRETVWQADGRGAKGTFGSASKVCATAQVTCDTCG